MKKALLLLLALAAASINSFAQFNYDLSVLTGAYQPLSTGTSVNGSTMWDDEYYKIPLGFNFSIEGKTISDFSLLSAQNCLTDTGGTVSGFIITDIDLHDRGNAGSSVSESPIRYVVTGSAPNRIFKLEAFNAGMYDEYDLYSTNNDSINYQVWLYETSNIVEIHIGDSKITHPSDYFYLSGSPIVGFIRNIDLDVTGNLDIIYYLTGNALNPTIDSATNIFSLNGGLNAYPPSGTVYRFTPKPVSVKGVEQAIADISLLSNSVHNAVTVKNASKAGVAYKVISTNGASMNISGSLESGIHSVDVSSLASGMYILHVQHDKGVKAFRFVKM